jgi:hypothetical protein
LLASVSVIILFGTSLKTKGKFNEGLRANTKMLGNYWLSGLCPSFGYSHTRKHNVSEIKYVSVFSYGE